MKPTLPLSSEFIKAHENKIRPLYERYERENALHPTLLISGLEGVGKKSLVLHFLEYLFCDQSIFASNRDADEETGSLFGDLAPAPVTTKPANTNGYRACGECKSCKRAATNQWLDLIWLEPETGADETKLGTHKIDAFREVKTKLGMGPVEEPFKVVVIADADRMTLQAANTILKTLEEPPKNWVFILTAADSSRLLPTILSRCIEVKLSPLTATQIYGILKDAPKEAKGADFNSQRATIASKAAQGSISRAQFFLEDDLWKTRSLLLGCLSNPAQEWMKLVEHLSSSQRELIHGLDLMESLFNDLLQHHVQGKAHEWVHADQRDFLVQWMESKRVQPARLIHVLSEIAAKRRLTGLTLNSKLLAQEVLIPLLETIIS